MKRTAKNPRADYRSHCPVNFAVESLGDRWALLIVRDMVFHGKKTYGEFLKAEEGIATNILASRLDFLERIEVIKKSPHVKDQRKDMNRASCCHWTNSLFPNSKAKERNSNCAWFSPRMRSRY